MNSKTNSNNKSSKSNLRKRCLLRLSKDLLHIQENGDISASPINDANLLEWKACIFGPSNSAFESGVFNLRLSFPITYPDQPPKVRFISPIFHPNVYKDGQICIDILQSKWSPAYTITTLITSLTSLLTDPNINSPANTDAAYVYVHNRKEYKRKVRRCISESLLNL